MVGKSLAIRGRATRRRKRACDRGAVLAAYESGNPGMIDSGAVEALLAKYADDLGRLLQRVQCKYDQVAADGALMYRAGGLRSRWAEVCVELHARGRLALYRCRDDEAKRALRAVAAFGAAGGALPSGVFVVGWVDVRLLRAATLITDDACDARFPFEAGVGRDRAQHHFNMSWTTVSGSEKLSETPGCRKWGCESFSRCEEDGAEIEALKVAKTTYF